MRPNPQFPANLVAFTEEILNGNLHILCTVMASINVFKMWSRLHLIELYFKTGFSVIDMGLVESAKLRALRVHVPTCLACLRAHVPCVLKCQRVLRAFCAYVPMCSRAITTNNKKKFSIICFLYIFVIVLSFFSLWNKTVIHCCIALTRRKPVTSAMTDFVQ